jgi:hypothetical protein
MGADKFHEGDLPAKIKSGHKAVILSYNRITAPLAKAGDRPMSGVIARDFVETNSCKIPQQRQ